MGPASTPSRRLHLLGTSVGAWILLLLPLVAQELPRQASALSEEAVAARIAALSSAPEVDAAATLDTWKRVLAQIRVRDVLLQSAAEYAATREEAPLRLDGVREQLSLSPDVFSAPAPDAPPSELDQALLQAERGLEDAKRVMTELEKERAQRTNRRTEIPKLITAARERLSGLAVEGAAPPDPQLAEAQRALAEAARAAVEAEIASLERERESYDARVELLAAREDLAARRLAQAQQILSLTSDAASQSRTNIRRATERSMALAAQEAATAHPAVALLAEDNLQLLRLLENRLAGREQSARRLSELQDELRALQDRRARMLAKTERMGFTNVVASLLRRERATLPSVAGYRVELEQRQRWVIETEETLLALEDDRADLSNLDRFVDQRLAASSQPILEAELEDTRSRLARLAAARRTLVDDAVTEIGGAFDLLVDMDATLRRMLDTLVSYSEFIDANILWARSGSVLSGDDVAKAGRAALELAGPVTWSTASSAAAASFHQRPGATILAATLLLGLLISSPLLRRRLRVDGSQALLTRVLPPAHLFRSLAMTVVLAAAWPLGLWTLGRLLSFGSHEESLALGAALRTLAQALAPVTLARALCMPHGLAEAILRWPSSLVRSTRHAAGLLLPVLGSMLLLALYADGHSSESLTDSLGRVALILGWLGTVIVVGGLLISQRASGTEAGATPARSGGGRRAFATFAITIALPIAASLAALLGYRFAAYRITLGTLHTWMLTLALVASYDLAMRWLVMEQRRVRLEVAQARRDAGQALEGGGSATDLPPAADALEPIVDVVQIDSQARSLARLLVAVALFVGLWWIWADALPALRELENIPLWYTTSPGLEASPDGAAPAVSLANLLAAIATVVLMISAARNVPGLLDVMVVRRLSLSRSSGYALATITRYSITIVGTSVTFGLLGIGWSKVQWLVAAMGLGLGFGLQEIFSNFMSGLILLFERRIRVDDVVTVGEVSGRVTRIQVLATTIRDWDRREYIVPNKDVITGKLLNWTLSDQVNRVVITVGVAYGTDTARARQVLLEVAHAHPLVLADPPPVTSFDLFDQSSLRLQLRTYLADMEYRLQVISELHEQVDVALRKAGVEIAFPQLDLHVRNPPGAAQPAPSQAPVSG